MAKLTQTCLMPPLPPIATEYVSTEEAGELLRVGPRVVARYIRSGALRGAKIGKAWLVNRADVCAFIESKMTQTVAA